MALEPHLNEGNIPCARADYPPQVYSVELLGQVRDGIGHSPPPASSPSTQTKAYRPVNESRNYARTHGCSTLLNYEPVFLFNDTFEISPVPGSSQLEYTPIGSVTAAFGSLSNPTLTTYPTYIDRHRIPQFIPFSRVEKAAGTDRGCYMTVFNSVVQVPGKEFGVVWFMKMRGGTSGRGADVFCGVGVAEVRIDGERGPRCDRKGALVFDGFGPRWGDISTVIHGDYIYLYGSGAPASFAFDGSYNDPVQKTSHPTATRDSKLDVPIYLCRVPHRNRAYWCAENYKCWNGENFVNFPQVPQFPITPFPLYQQGRVIPRPPPVFKCVMKNVQSGTIMHSQLFSEQGHFIFIGCELGGGENKEVVIKMRLADEPMGPWFGEASLFNLNKVNRGNNGVKFGVHAHSWASNLENGEILVSWTEPWPGGVEMARVKLVMKPSPIVMVSTASATTTTTTNVVQSSIHSEENPRAVIGDYFDEEPIPEDLEPELKPESESEPGSGSGPEPKSGFEFEFEFEPVSQPEPESEEDEELKLRKRTKARDKALAKLAGSYRREEDSDGDTESVFDFKAAFQNLFGRPRPASPSSIVPYPSGYDLRTAIPGDITGSWILNERDCRYSNVFNNHDGQDQQIATLGRQLEVTANSDNCTNSSSANSSPHTNNQSSWLNDSDTNTDYSTSVPPTASLITSATNTAPQYAPSGPNAFPYQHLHGTSPPLPGAETATEKSLPSVFDTDSSSQASDSTTVPKKKSPHRKNLWGKKARAEVGEEVGGGNEKKGWKNSIKKSAIAKFLRGGV
ncbi:unnamed protein product [Tuber aestivum]|uniref:Uncharacterized protein n=1 Tax=Tuber aestivum TaxID=59557 RepID=A0A292Q694_9PEZI|nr:unnamed protein product [Tuber aestivum]